MIEDECPLCERLPVGSQIVELSHPNTDDVTYGVVCPECNIVYSSVGAKSQMERRDD